MAFTNLSSVGGSAQSKTAGTSFGVSVSGANIPAGSLVLALIAKDNTSTTDGDNGEVTSVTDTQSNTWTKVREFTNGQGSAAAGATVSLWRSVLTTQLAIGNTVTFNFASCTAKAAALRAYSFGAGNTIGVANQASLATDGGTFAGAITLSGLTSREYLFVRGIAGELTSPWAGAVSTVDSVTYPVIASNGTSGGGAASNMWGSLSLRILTATSEGTNNGSALSAQDFASVMAALYEIPSGDTATPSPATSTWTAVAAAIILGAVSVTPSPAVHTWTNPAPSVAVGAVSVAPASALATWLAANPNVTVGGVTAAPAPATSTWVNPAATGQLGGGGPVTATPASAIANWVANSPAVALGGVTAAPTSAVGTWVATTPSVTLGNATASPSPAIGNWVANAPSTSVGAVTASPAPSIATWVAKAASTTVGAVTASPSSAITTWTVAQAIAGGSGLASPLPAIATWVVPTAAISLGPITASPAPASSSWTAKDPTVTEGNVSAQPGAAVFSWTVPQATVFTRLELAIAVNTGSISIGADINSASVTLTPSSTATISLVSEN